MLFTDRKCSLVFWRTSSILLPGIHTHTTLIAAMNVLVYSGPDVEAVSASGTLTSLRSLLILNYAVQTITSQALAGHPWSATCSLLVLPSLLASTVPSSASNSRDGTALSPAATKAIQNYVSAGGRLLSLGTGVRAHSRRAITAFSLSTLVAGVSITEKSPPPKAGKLTLEDPDSRLSFELTPASSGDATAAPAAAEAIDGTRVEGLTCAGEVDLTEVVDVDTGLIKALAHLPSEPSSPQRGTVAAIQANIGRGTAAFWNVHLETQLTIEKDERARVALLHGTLQNLGLRLPSSDASENPRPAPQILSSAPWRPGVVGNILIALAVPSLADTETFEYKDSNDMFIIHSCEGASRAFVEQRTDFQPKADPASWNPKRVIVYTDGALPPSDLTPRFDVAQYYEELKKARAERGCPENYPEGLWGVGEALLYGEVVTSTQTMLDK